MPNSSHQLVRIVIVAATCISQFHTLTRADSVDAYQDKESIRSKIAAHLNQYYKANKYFGQKAYDFRAMDRRSGKYLLSSLDIEASWALAAVTPRRQTPPEPFVPDGAGFLLKKQKGQWRVLGMGTSLDGFGKKFGVPKRLWKKWSVE